MAIKLVTKSGNINLTTGGVPQSEINELLAAQEEKLNKEHEYEIELITEAHEEVVHDLNTTIDELAETNRNLSTENDNLEMQVGGLNATVDALNTEIGSLNTTIDALETENDELEEELADLKEIAGTMPTPVEGVEF